MGCFEAPKTRNNDALCGQYLPYCKLCTEIRKLQQAIINWAACPSVGQGFVKPSRRTAAGASLRLHSLQILFEQDGKVLLPFNAAFIGLQWFLSDVQWQILALSAVGHQR